MENDSTEASNDFKDIVVANVEGRKGGEMFKAFTEAMPNLDKSIYMDMMATIEGKRDGLKRSQDQLADIKREHDNLRLKFPSSIIACRIHIMRVRRARGWSNAGQ